jgi:Putative methyltransferase.
MPCGGEHESCFRRQWEWVLASDCTYGHDAHAVLAATLRALLRGGARRAVLAHEHCSRTAILNSTLRAWDEGDEHLEAFACAAAAEGLCLAPLWSERPRCIRRGSFRSWTADLSVIEIALASSTSTNYKVARG